MALCGLSSARANGHWTRGCSQQAHHRPNQPHQAFTLVSIRQTALPKRGSEHLITGYYSFIDLERMKGWVDQVGWPVADGLPTQVVTHQLQAERRTAKARRPRTKVLPLNHCLKYSYD